MDELEESLSARVKMLEVLVEHLIEEARINNRIAIVAVAVMAAGKEILTVMKNVV